MIRTFISYSHKNIEEARKLYENLNEVEEIEPWFDKESLLPGMRWKPAIRKAIRESEYFLALISHESMSASGYINKEINVAIEILQEFPEDQIFFIPIRLNDCKMPFEELSELQWVDLFPDWDEGFSKIVKVLTTSREKEEPDITENSVKTKEPYHYRIGLVDLDIGLTSTESIAKKLNSIQNFFHFTTPSLPPVHEYVRDINGLRNLAVFVLPKSFYLEHKYLNVDLVANLTKFPLAFRENDQIQYNYFSGPSKVDDRFLFISTNQLYSFTKEANCTFEKGLIHILVSQLVVYFTNLGYHREIKGCIMDFCEIRSDIVVGLKNMEICSSCLEQIKNGGFKSSINSMLNDPIII